MRRFHAPAPGRAHGWRRRRRPPGSARWPTSASSPCACSASSSRGEDRRRSMQPGEHPQFVADLGILRRRQADATAPARGAARWCARRGCAHAGRGQRRGRAIGDQPAVVEDGEAMAALGLVHVVGRHQDRGAGVREVEQLFPESARRDSGSTALVGSSRNSSSGACTTAPASARRCFCPPLMVPASCDACASGRRSPARRRPAGRRRAYYTQARWRGTTGFAHAEVPYNENFWFNPIRRPGSRLRWTVPSTRISPALA